MKLLKVKNGLLEAENFFLASPFGDFAGSANVTRDISTGKLQLISNDIKIERKFEFTDFVIELEKENFDNVDVGDFSMIYLGNDNISFGIKDKDPLNQNKYWKILREDGYIQAYSSMDGINYTNVGGMSYAEPLLKQGFRKLNNKPFILDSYKVYRGPYVTVQNFPEDTICELYDSSNNLLKTRIFDATMECNIFLDYNNLDGYLVFKDPLGSILFTSNSITFGYGDVWVFSPYNFEITYLGNVVGNMAPALLQDLDEVINIKNIGSVAYTGIVIGTQTSGNDLIELSLDGLTYSSTITLDFAIDEEKQIYVKVTKNAANNSFYVRDFQLVIN
ncbi:hypothetical protein JOC70_000757 [Clostridium pascui]|uniref:hypothetical protein n=1 Tax=Clostridium pascui TaxID=46609 RepID=UPI00195BF49E|nr:hypothetical protein [Clostridium pascui]MBM7869288.1 hypothetical protein [Clostridium pascui]